MFPSNVQEPEDPQQVTGLEGPEAEEEQRLLAQLEEAETK